jgi:hypothetical protein
MESNSDVGALEVSPTVHVELADSVHVERRAERLVQKLDRCDIGVVSEVIAQLVKRLEGNLYRVTLGPLGSALELTGVVETVLRPGSAVKIEHDFDAMVASPANCLAS